MSDRLCSRIWQLDLELSVKAVLLAMGDVALEDGTGVWPSIAYLAHRCQISERQIQRHIKTLEAKKLLIPLRTGGGRNRTNEWRIELANGDFLTPFEPPSTTSNSKNGDMHDTLSPTSIYSGSPNGDIHDTVCTKNGDIQGNELPEKGDILTPQNGERVTSATQKGDVDVTRSGSLDPGGKNLPPSLREAPKGAAHSEEGSPPAGDSGAGAQTIGRSRVKPPKHAAQEFRAFWAAYPARENPEDAVKAWDRVKPTPDEITVIMALLTPFAAEPLTPDEKANVPAPGVWIRGRRWTNDLPFKGLAIYRQGNAARASPPSRHAPAAQADRQREIENRRREADERDQAEREIERIDAAIAAMSPAQRDAIEQEARRRVLSSKFVRDRDPNLTSDSSRKTLTDQRRKIFKERYPERDWRTSSLPAEGDT